MKERLELEKIKTKEGRTRWTVKPISDVLTFDKVLVNPGGAVSIHCEPA